jgi:hypothetical protein
MTDIASSGTGYGSIHSDIVAFLERGRRAAARSVNALTTTTYSIGCQFFEVIEFVCEPRQDGISDR